MPDRYDPKVPPRAPSGTRKGPSLEDDPLAELAKIVQGRPASSGSAPAKGRPGTPPPERGPATSFSDLEAELLNDLQASFAAVNEAAANPPPRPAPPVRAEPRARPEPPPRPLPPPEPPASAFEPPRQEPRVEARTDPHDDLPSTRFVPIPPPPVMQPPLVHHTASEPAPERVPRGPRPPAAGEGNAEASTEPGPFQLRPTLQPTPDQPPRQPRSRWEKPEPPKPHAAGASRFAPPQSARPPQPATAFEDADDEADPFAEGGIFAEAVDHDDAGEPPPDGPDTVPGYGDDDQFPPLDEFAPPPGSSRRRNLMLIGGVLVVVVVGGAAFAVLRSGGEVTTPPPVIVADAGPTKITPDDTAQTSTDVDQQNKLIYDRLSANGNTNNDTTLVKPGDTQVAALPSASGTQNPISRVIIPGGPGYDTPPAGAGQQTAAPPPPAANTTASDTTQVAAGDQSDTDSAEAIGPRKVRTVVVKPDGTIVSSAATDAPPVAAPAATTVVATAPAPPTPTVAPAAGPVTDDTQAIAGTKELPITPVPDPTGSATTMAGTKVPSLDTPPPVAAPARPVPPVTIIKPPPKTVVAASDQPIDLAANPPAATATTGGMLVQVSSQRTEDAARATFRDLQSRYPAILGKYAVNIQQADVADRGTFFRVRVGPFSPADAQRLCDDLKSAGGDCLLARQ